MPKYDCPKNLPRRACGAWSFHRKADEIEKTVRHTAKTYRVRVRLYQNVGNHLPVAAQAATRQEFQNFLRVLPQAIAFLVTGTRKGNAIGRFWSGLAYSRVVHWGKDFDRLRVYFERNRVEAAGVKRAEVDRWFQEAGKLAAG